MPTQFSDSAGVTKRLKLSSDQFMFVLGHATTVAQLGYKGSKWNGYKDVAYGSKSLEWNSGSIAGEARFPYRREST
jgi:hypothetical protein